MLLKSSNGISIGNGKNYIENRKTSAASFSSSYINKHVTKTDTILTKPSKIKHDDNAKQQPKYEQQLNELIQPSSSFFTNSITSFQSDSLSSKFKFEITPQTIHHFNQNKKTNSNRPHIQWSSHHASSSVKTRNSSANSSTIFTQSSIDVNATNIKTESLNTPDVLITEMSSKDFNNEYQFYVDQNYQKNNSQYDLNQSLKSISINVVSDDEIDDDEKEPIFVDQANQTSTVSLKVRKTIKSAASHKKIKSATKRPKQASATQIIQQPITSVQSVVSSSSPNRISSQIDLKTATVQNSTSSNSRIDDNNAGKNLITVDTSKARSNLEVVRICLRELGWKEVRK